ncbi:secondary thiamine-phosphate synthase enzyme YjbQ [Kitasatospora purpeofusca]|uniref:secondary thiamine-phosphate synthase enzyme YjbQ n=1 Tax=Kitasatospora purpeofusca TaxID=67352 RepID=UPI0036D3E966
MADHTHTPHAPHSPSFRTETFEITTGSREVALDITDRCARFLDGHAVGRDGLLNVFVPHATAGIAVLETGSGSDDDLLAALRDLLPADERWRHRHGSPGHGRDHVVPGLVAPHATLPVIDGRLALGVWQSVVLVDTNGDNPRRTVRLSFLG